MDIYVNFINGKLDGTPQYELGGKVYDKLNRVFYTDAKKSGMSSPNYIMTRIMNRTN
jgi:hypothetical protein